MTRLRRDLGLEAVAYLLGRRVASRGSCASSTGVKGLERRFDLVLSRIGPELSRAWRTLRGHEARRCVA